MKTVDNKNSVIKEYNNKFLVKLLTLFLICGISFIVSHDDDNLAVSCPPLVRPLFCTLIYSISTPLLYYKKLIDL